MVDLVVLLVDLVDEVVGEVADGLFGEGGLKKLFLVGILGWVVVSALKNKDQTRANEGSIS